jgi:hypothetical protein
MLRYGGSILVWLLATSAALDSRPPTAWNWVTMNVCHYFKPRAHPAAETREAGSLSHRRGHSPACRRIRDGREIGLRNSCPSRNRIRRPCLFRVQDLEPERAVFR